MQRLLRPDLSRIEHNEIGIEQTQLAAEAIGTGEPLDVGEINPITNDAYSVGRRLLLQKPITHAFGDSHDDFESAQDDALESQCNPLEKAAVEVTNGKRRINFEVLHVEDAPGAHNLRRKYCHRSGK